MKKFLLMAVFAIVILGFALPSKAADTPAVITGALSSATTITGYDSSGTIDPSTGAYTPSVSQPKFTFITNTDVDLDGTLTSAKVSTADTLGQYNSAVRLALTNSNHVPLQAAVENAMGFNAAVPDPASNANVIAYALSATSNYTGATPFTWQAGAFKGKIYDVAALSKGDTVNVTIGAPDTAGTFSNNDLMGSYTATLTLTASDS